MLPFVEVSVAAGGEGQGRMRGLIVWLLLFFLLNASPAWAEPGFSEKYERDYNIFNPINQYRPDNPLNPINAVDPTNPSHG